MKFPVAEHRLDPCSSCPTLDAAAILIDASMFDVFVLSEGVMPLFMLCLALKMPSSLLLPPPPLALLQLHKL